MNKGIVTFGECEHNGDLDNYIEDLQSSGAKISESVVDVDSEEGKVTVEVENFSTFLLKFKTTDSYGFSSLCN